jgi:hypothetical protein
LVPLTLAAPGNTDAMPDATISPDADVIDKLTWPGAVDIPGDPVSVSDKKAR